MITTYESHSEQQTHLYGKQLAATLKAGDVIAFCGDLGAGKTALTRGIAAYFGVDDVQSPTFTLVNEYQSTPPLYHFDAYRITEADWLDSGFDEYLFGDGICLIEWSERLTNILPPHTITIALARDLSKGEDYRTITLSRKD